MNEEISYSYWRNISVEFGLHEVGIQVFDLMDDPVEALLLGIVRMRARALYAQHKEDQSPPLPSRAKEPLVSSARQGQNSKDAEPCWDFDEF